MPQLTIGGVVRDILKTDLTLSADEVIRLARARGLKAPDSSIRNSVHNIRSELKRQAAKAAPAAARQTAEPRPQAAAPTTAPAPADLTAVLANVALVARVVAACGGVESARQVAEAVRACGGVDAFAMHLDLIANLRGTEPTA